MLRNSNKSIGTTSRKNQNAERLWLLRVRSDSRTASEQVQGLYDSSTSRPKCLFSGKRRERPSSGANANMSIRAHRHFSLSSFWNSTCGILSRTFLACIASSEVSRNISRPKSDCLCLDHFPSGTYPAPNLMYSSPCAPVTVFACGPSLPVATEYLQTCLTPVEQRSDTFSHRTPRVAPFQGRTRALDQSRLERHRMQGSTKVSAIEARLWIHSDHGGSRFHPTNQRHVAES